MKKIVSLLAILVFTCLSVAANATLLTFDEYDGANIVSAGIYESDGFRLTAGNLSGIGSSYDLVFTTGAMFGNTGEETITLERVDGNSFSFNSIDITRFPGYTNTAPINMLAFNSSNVQIDLLSFVVPNITEFNTYSIGFTGVHKVTWRQQSAFHAFDNISLDEAAAVPAPATLALLGLGLAGLGWSKRKKA